MKSLVTYILFSVFALMVQAQEPSGSSGKILSPAEVFQARRNLVQWWIDNKYGHRCANLGGNQFWQAILSPYTHKKLKLDGIDPLLSAQFSGQEAECQGLDFEKSVLNMRVGTSASVSTGNQASMQKRASVCYEAVENLMKSELAMVDKPNPSTITCPLRSELGEEEDSAGDNEMFFEKNPNRTSK